MSGDYAYVLLAFGGVHSERVGLFVCFCFLLGLYFFIFASWVFCVLRICVCACFDVTKGCDLYVFLSCLLGRPARPWGAAHLRLLALVT